MPKDLPPPSLFSNRDKFVSEAYTAPLIKAEFRTRESSEVKAGAVSVNEALVHFRSAKLKRAFMSKPNSTRAH